MPTLFLLHLGLRAGNRPNSFGSQQRSLTLPLVPRMSPADHRSRRHGSRKCARSRALVCVVFFGTTDTGRHCLERLLTPACRCRAVTVRDQFDISYANEPVTNLRHSRFDDLAASVGAPVLTFERRFDEPVSEWLEARAARLFVVVGWYHMIPGRIRALATLGAVGVHWSLLPRYRGGSPLVWAIINGKKETGASLFRFEDEVDAGAVFGQRTVAIGPDEYVADLIAKLNAVSGDLIAEHVPKLLAQTASSWEQDHGAATPLWRRALLRTAGSTGQLPDRRSTTSFAHKGRHPGAYFDVAGHRIHVDRANLSASGAVRARAGDGSWVALEVIRVDDSTTAIPAGDWFGPRRELDLVDRP